MAEKMDVTQLSTFLTVSVLAETDIEAVLALAGRNPLFYKHCPPFPSRQSIADDMKALPPRMTLRDKYYLGFFQGDTLMAVMDLILGYPNAATAFIGFFMTEKATQGRGLGSRIITECGAYLKNIGFSHIRLGYVKGNPQSKAFWEKNGFAPTGVESRQEL